jgi:hypothetical protein
VVCEISLARRSFDPLLPAGPTARYNATGARGARLAEDIG